MSIVVDSPKIDDPRLIARSALAARQWETHLEAERLSAGVRAWQTPTLATYPAWRRELYDLAGHNARQLLGRRQAAALWQRVVAESRLGDSLLDHRSVARWAYEAWRLLADYEVPTGRARDEAPTDDFNALLEWVESYRERLAGHHWVDDVLLESDLRPIGALPAGRITLLDAPDLTPAQQTCVAALRERGWRINVQSLPVVGRIAAKTFAASREDELRTAVAWAEQIALAEPSARIGLVVPDLAERRGLLESLLAGGAALDHGYVRPRMSADRPAVAAALNGLEMLSPTGSFAEFSLWLRSPFFHGRSSQMYVEASRLETQLRPTLWTRVSLLDALQRGGLRERLRSSAPEIGGCLDSAVEWLPSPSQPLTPTAWARTWQRVLGALGWGSPFAAIPEDDQMALDNGFEQLEGLSPVLGPLSYEAALAEFESLLSDTTPRAADLPIAGLHIFESIDDVGPGYDAVWATGFGEHNWPQPVTGNPLLPHWLQKRHGMPWATPADTLERSRKAVQRVVESVPNVCFSWAAEDELPIPGPSPLLDGIASAPIADFVRGHTRRAAPLRLGARTMDRSDDAPLRLVSEDIHGGVAVLNMQSRCPLRAFLEYRLNARTLAEVSSGIPAELRGTMIHRAAELFLPRGTRREHLSAADDDELASRIDECSTKAVADTFRRMRPLLPQLYATETRRVRALLASLVEQERLRAAFEVVEAEHSRSIVIRGHKLRVRIDRLDRLEDDSLALIDYKTGTQTSVAGWFAERLTDAQIPVYATQLGSNLSSAVICSLRPDAVAYKGFWNGSGAFPGREAKLPESLNWQALIALWSTATEGLVEEFVAGDCRIFPEFADRAAGLYAPLTRVYETLAALAEDEGL